MTFYKPRKTNIIPSVHKTILGRSMAIENERSEGEVRYADEGIPQITYEQAHGQTNNEERECEE